MNFVRCDVLLFGANGAGSTAALAQLVELGLNVTVVGVVSRAISSDRDIMAVRATSGLEAMARKLGVTFRGVSEPSDVIDELKSIRADIALSSCFPWRLPVNTLKAVASRCLNIHPSRLPAWRGPDPLFWQLRAGYSVIPVSVHDLADRMDTGPVRASAEIQIESGDTEAALEDRIARKGVMLVCGPQSTDPVSALDNDVITDRGLWHRSPVPADYRVFPTWRVGHATRFLSLMAGRNVPFRYLNPGQRSVEFGRLFRDGDDFSDGFSINLADGAIRVLMKNRA